jgi:hypothetical protein
LSHEERSNKLPRRDEEKYLMPNLDQDKLFLSAGTLALPDYILSKELFYPLGGDLPRLTLGNLLLAQKRLSGLGNEGQFLEINAFHEKWPAAWDQKVNQEIHTRLELWNNFLGDYRTSPEMNADRYPVEVRHRAILNLLIHELDKPPELDQLPKMDSLLKECLIPGNMVWEKQVEPAFDKFDFWFLYGRLRSQ